MARVESRDWVEIHLGELGVVDGRATVPLTWTLTGAFYRAIVIGRSLVIGKPVAMMLLKENATVTTCHTRTVDLPGVTRDGDIIIACAGAAEMVTAEHVKSGQTIIDVGINFTDDGRPRRRCRVRRSGAHRGKHYAGAARSRVCDDDDPDATRC